MKRARNPRNPNREQKKMISKEGLDARHWKVISEDKHCLVIKHKETLEIKRVEKL